MKSVAQLSWILFSSIVFSNPVQIDVNLRVDTEDTANAVKGSPRCQLGKSTSSSALPKVTLGYEIHQASPLKEGQSYYAFENIPYAKQPIGDRRFKAAKELTFADEVENPPLNDGSKSVVCPQGVVGWYSFANDWSNQLFNPDLDLDPKFSKPIEPKDYPPPPKPFENQSEECLMLDVFVPKRVYDDENAIRRVIVSFHGGGFIFGSKTVFGSPAGILKAAGEKGTEGDVIVVSVNYRLGAFGWLAGEEFVDGGGFENAGLSDQKAALEWVYWYINMFGGDNERVTVLGESAGASSILHHLTAYGFGPQYDPPAKFERAILQSPAFFPQVSPRQMNATYHDFLKTVGVNNFAELQNAKSEDLMKANRETVYQSPYGTFTYGPVVSFAQKSSSTYVQYPPSIKLMIGSWYSDRKVMIANNRREGALFTPPWLRNEKDLATYIRSIYPAISDDSFKEFAELYPVPQTKRDLFGRIIPTTERERFTYAAAAFGDLGIDCTAWQFKEKAAKSNYRYFYRIYPGFHGQDVGATWYPEAGEDLTKPIFNPQSQSERLQRWITCFAKDDDANPNCAKHDDDKDFLPMSDGAMWIGFGLPILDKDKKVIPDENYAMSKLTGDLPSAQICQFWSSAPYWEDDPEAANLKALLRTQKSLGAEL